MRNRSKWILGTVKEIYEGGMSLTPDGIWALQWEFGQCWALTPPKTQLSINNHPSKIGVYLDFDARIVEFYDHPHRNPIFTFTFSSTEKMPPSSVASLFIFSATKTLSVLFRAS